MTVLLDTSVLVPALIEALPEHERAARYLRRGLRGEIGIYVAAHALAELYAVLTTLPLSPRLTPGQTRRLIRQNIASHARVVPLDGADYEVVIDRMTDLGLAGGAIYDGLHVRAAEKSGVDQLLTFNRRDFQRMPPEGSTELVVL